MKLTVQPGKSFSGSIQVPGDKSISHRALLLSAMAKGHSEIRGALDDGDCRRTINCLRCLGAVVQELTKGHFLVKGKGLHGFREPTRILHAGNSGTTMRLLLGILAGQSFASVITGDSSLRERPMERVTVPLIRMGSEIIGRQNNSKAPLAVRGRPLKGLDRYAIPVASAQVKSSLLLAGCYAEGKHNIIETVPTRNHTEIMFSEFGVSLERHHDEIIILGGQEPSPAKVRVPGDFSSASFLMAAALLLPGSQLAIEQVGLNPTRTGFLDVIRAMGGKVTIIDQDIWNGEPVGTLVVEASPLQGVEVPPEWIPRLIDEIPVLVVLASYAEGDTVISGAEELRYKESDRIHAMATELRKMGAAIEERPDGMVVQGRKALSGTIVRSHGDHRIAMALAVAALAAENTTTVLNAGCIKVSFSDFAQIIQSRGW